MPATRANRPPFINWFNAGDNNTEQRLERVNGAWEWVIRPIVTRTQLVLRALNKILRKIIDRARNPRINLVDYHTIAPDYYIRYPNHYSRFGPSGSPFEYREDGRWRVTPGQEWWHVRDARGFNDIVDLAARDQQYMQGRGYTHPIEKRGLGIGGEWQLMRFVGRSPCQARIAVVSRASH
jgi:hypothetical protein